LSIPGDSTGFECKIKHRPPRTLQRWRKILLGLARLKLSGMCNYAAVVLALIVPEM
jgi:hypothetical protein